MGLTVYAIHCYLSVLLTVTHYSLLMYLNIVFTLENFLLSTLAPKVYIPYDIV
jgi:hypothetical protein